MIRSLVRWWVGDPEEKVVVLRLPKEIYNGLDTVAYIINKRRIDMGSAQGGIDNWPLVTVEKLLTEAAADTMRKHLQVTVPKPTTLVEYGSGRIQKRR